MEIPLEKIAAELLKTTEDQKTPECVSVDTLGEYIEHTIPGDEWNGVEKHLRSCLYCLNQLVDLRELLYLEKNAEPLPRSLERKLRHLAAQETGAARENWFEVVKGYALAVLETTREIFGARSTWQAVSALSLAVLVIVTYFGFFQHHPENYAATVGATVDDSIVTVRGMDANKRTVRQGAGAVVDARGFVLLPLHLITDVASGQVTLTGGVTLPIKGLLRGYPESDLAVVELDTASTLKLKALKIADPSTMRAGQRVIALSKKDSVISQVSDGVLGDIIPLNFRTRGTKETKPSTVARQFIPVGSKDVGLSQAILVDTKGAVVSVNTVSPEGEKTGLAMPIGDIDSIIKSPPTPTPLGELNYKNHPPEAALYYVKGILAYNSGDIDRAINYQLKCLKIDPSFDRAHEELGGMYFLKADHEKEIFHFQEAVRQNRENVDARAYLAQSYEDEGRYDLAITEFEQLLAIKSNDEEARYNLGIDYLVIGRTDKALEQYEALKHIHEGAANKLKRVIDLALPRRGVA